MGFPHPPPPQGGPGSFQIRLTEALEAAGHRVTYPDASEIPDVVLVVAGTRRIRWLLRCKRQGSRIVHRLNGLNWLGRYHRLRPRGKLKARLQNRLLLFIRNRIADCVVYQSDFARSWWHAWYGPAPCREYVVHNGVDLESFRPALRAEAATHTMLCAEGRIEWDRITQRVLLGVHRSLWNRRCIERTLVCAGMDPEVADVLRREPGIEALGSIPRQKMPEIFGQVGFYLSLDILSACPNGVIEALAAGVPVVGLDTGSLSELVLPGGGLLAEYGGNPWRLDRPDVRGLVSAAEEVLGSMGPYSRRARLLAEDRLGLETMVERYLRVMMG